MLALTLSLLSLLNLVAGFHSHHVAKKHVAGLVQRQASLTVCSTVAPGPSLCARSCGAGNIICPGGGLTYCFNPGAGETCCQDGGYCPAGQYCAKLFDGDVGCCLNNQTLAQCGAAARGATIAGGSSSSVPTSSSSSIAPGGGISSQPGGSSQPHSSSARGGSTPAGGVSSVAPSCTPVENPTCENSCGQGWVMCRELPHCYNPGLGQTCCADGSYCPAGSSCSPDGCCPDGEQCGGNGGVSSSAVNVVPSSHVVIPTTPGVTYTPGHSQPVLPGQTTRTTYVPGQPSQQPNPGSPSQAPNSTVLAGIASTDLHIAFDAIAVLLGAFGVFML